MPAWGRVITSLAQQVEESDPSDFEFEDEEQEGKQVRLESDEEELSPDDDDESGACVLLYTEPH